MEYGRTDYKSSANNGCARRVPREGRQRLQRAAAASLSARARNPERSPTHFPKAWAIWPTSLAQPISMAAYTSPASGRALSLRISTIKVA
jgi:hypothetical protein